MIQMYPLTSFLPLDIQVFSLFPSFLLSSCYFLPPSFCLPVIFLLFTGDKTLVFGCPELFVHYAYSYFSKPQCGLFGWVAVSDSVTLCVQVWTHI